MFRLSSRFLLRGGSWHPLGRGSSRWFSMMRSNGAKAPHQFYRQRVLRGVGLGMIAGISWGLYERHHDRVIRNDDLVSIQPPTKCEPFPTGISLNGLEYKVLGVGVRAVTFMNFHVYACGIYVANDDIPRCRDLLAVRHFNPQNIDSSNEAIDALLKANIRFVLRIMPVRNTDYHHLRDGFVRAIIHHPVYREVGDTDAFARSLQELKKALGPGRKFPKGDILTFIRESDGSMSIYHSEGTSQDVYARLTHITSPQLARIFFLNYMSGRKPPSPSLKSSVQDGLVELSL